MMINVTVYEASIFHYSIDIIVSAEPESKSLHSRRSRSSQRSPGKRYSQAPISDIEGAFLRHARYIYQFLI